MSVEKKSLISNLIAAKKAIAASVQLAKASEGTAKVSTLKGSNTLKGANTLKGHNTLKGANTMKGSNTLKGANTLKRS